MNSKSTTIATLALLVGLASADAALAATASGTASAEIVSAIAISSTANLNFGQIAPSGSAGTVSVSPAASPSATRLRWPPPPSR
jgi:hypothetical protein